MLYDPGLRAGRVYRALLDRIPSGELAPRADARVCTAVRACVAGATTNDPSTNAAGLKLERPSYEQPYFTVLGTYLGKRLLDRLPAHLFPLLIEAALVLSGLQSLLV
jgi:hypothetical protein